MTDQTGPKRPSAGTGIPKVARRAIRRDASGHEGAATATAAAAAAAGSDDALDGPGTGHGSAPHRVGQGAGPDIVGIVVGREITALAARHKAANGLGMQVLDLVGGQAENLIERLPDSVSTRLEALTRSALEASLAVAGRSRKVLPDGGDWLNRAVATALGAVGGLGGLPSSVAELPVTITVLLRAIQGIAAEHGFDPDTAETRADCLRVMASSGPLAEDDGADLGLLAARVTLTGQGLHALIARVAPRLAVVLGQKLAAQTVPVIGAVAGAATNYAFTSYYQDMARVHFGLRRLAETTGRDRAELTDALRMAIKQTVSPPARR